MSNDEVVIRTHRSLEDELKRIKYNIQTKIARDFNGVQVQVPSNIASQVAAKRLQGIKSVEFEIEKKGLNKGKMKLL